MTPKEYIIYLEKQGIPRPSLLFLASAEFGDVSYRLELGNCKRPIDADWTDEVQDYIDSLPARPSLLFLASAAYQEQATVWQGVEPYCLRESNQNTGMQGFRRLRLVDVSTGKSMGITKPNEPGVEGYIAPIQNSAACPIPGTLSISPDSRSLGPGEYTFPLYITSNSDWTISGASSGISFSATSGSGSQVVQVTVSGNTQESERTLSFFVATTGGTTRSMTITQEAYVPPFLEVTPNSFDVEAGITNTTFEINTNRDWVILSDDEELLIVPKQGGPGTTQVTVTVGSNQQFTEREFVISIVADELEETVIINQEARLRELNLSKTVESVGPGSGSMTVDVDSNTDWEVINLPSGVTVSPMQGSGDATLTIDYPQNTSQSENLIQIHLQTLVGGVDAYLNITQSYSVLSVSPQTYNARQQGVSIQVEIQSNGPWEIHGDPDLFFNGYPSTSGTGNATITMEIDANESFTQRTLTATVNAPGTSQTITVTQDANTRQLSVTPTSRSVGYQAGSSSFQVKSNTFWQVESIPTWASINMTEGQGDAQINISYDANPVAYLDTGVFRVNLRDENKTATFNLTRNAAPKSLTLIPNTVNIYASGGGRKINVQSNYRWRIHNVEQIPSWIEVNVNEDFSNGVYDGSIDIAVDGHTSLSSRSFNLEVADDDLQIIRQVQITQEGDTVTVIEIPFTISVVDVQNNSIRIMTTQEIPPGEVSITYSEVGGPTTRYQTTVPEFRPIEWLIDDLDDGKEYEIEVMVIVDSGVNEVTLYQSNTITASTLLIPQLIVSPDSLTVQSNGGSVNFEVQSNVPWSASDNRTWMSVTPSNGNQGVSQVSVNVDPNEGAYRSGSVSVTGQGAPTRTVAIGQQAITTYPVVMFGRGTGVGDFDGADTPDEAMNNNISQTIYATSPKNNIGIGTRFYMDSGLNAPLEGDSKWYRIESGPRVVRIDNGGYFIDIVDTNISLNVSPSTLSVGDGQSVRTLNVESNSDWQVSSKPAWVTQITPSNGSGNTSVSITIANNPDSTPRSGSINFRTANYQRTANVQIQQQAYSAVTPQNPSVPKAGGTFTITVSTAGAWSVQTPLPSQIYIPTNQLSGTGNSIINVTVSANPFQENLLIPLIINVGGVNHYVYINQAGSDS